MICTHCYEGLKLLPCGGAVVHLRLRGHHGHPPDGTGRPRLRGQHAQTCRSGQG